jgi:hypothetical protein
MAEAAAPQRRGRPRSEIPLDVAEALLNRSWRMKDIAAQFNVSNLRQQCAACRHCHDQFYSVYPSAVELPLRILYCHACMHASMLVVAVHAIDPVTGA